MQMLSDKTPPTVYNVQLFIDVIKKRLNDRIVPLKETIALQKNTKEKSPVSPSSVNITVRKERSFLPSNHKILDK